MRFSTSIEYAVHGLVYLARASADRAILISEIAAAIKVPETYLRKVFQQLARRGILASQRGAKGGFRLGRDPGSITLKDVVEAIDGSLPVYSCLKVVRGCRLSHPCPVQETFEEARLRMAEVLDGKSLKNLLDDVSQREPAADWLRVTA
jgi:Rrf2 family iron-sulfur cluster assembly transcriptional regulator